MRVHINSGNNKLKAIITLSAVLVAGIANAQPPGPPPIYWVDSRGDFVRGGDGHCVRTIHWTAEREIPECEGKQPKVVSAPAPEPTPPPPPAPVEKVMTFPEAALFAFGKSELTPAGREAIQQYREQARAELSSAKSITIVGHTDNVGSAEFNQKLSEQRAEAVRDYLVSLGGDATKMTVIGKGETEPVADNSTPEGRAKNRRVEVHVIGVSK
jgi:OOP family OmpA-OmpF porin